MHDTPLTPADRAYTDQIEATLRQWGPMSILGLAGMLPETPAVRTANARRGLLRPPSTTSPAPSALIPYLGALMDEYAVTVDDTSPTPTWRATAPETTIHELDDPVPDPLSSRRGDKTTRTVRRRPW